MRTSCWFAIGLCLASLGGCGSHVPSFVYSKQPHAEALAATKIIDRVQCELREAVRATVKHDLDNAREHGGVRRIPWMEDWSAKLTLTMSVDEKSTISPNIGVTIPARNSITTFSNGPVTLPQSYGGAIGIGATSQAIRTQSVDYFYLFKSDFLSLAAARHGEDCIGGDGILIESDLKLKEWLEAATLPFYLPKFVQPVPPQTLTYRAQFYVTLSGNVTPIWRLIPVSANPVTPFLSGQRLRTDDILITLGAPTDNGLKPSTQLEDSHFAAKISAGLADALRSQ